MTRIKKIEGFDGYYADTEGNVWSTIDNHGKQRVHLMRPNLQGQINFSRNNGIRGKTKMVLCYRLIAQLFIPIPDEYKDIPVEELDVHHIDFNHNNNRVENLMWITKEKHREIHNKSDITGKRISEANKGHIVTDEARKKIGDAQRGEKAYWYGKKQPLEMIAKRAEKMKGHIVTDETRKKISKSQPKKRISQYTENGDFIAEYESAHEAERQTGVAFQNISKVCSGKRPLAGGFIWCFAS